jgi:hypothetical protein
MMAGNPVLLGHLTALGAMIGQLYAMAAIGRSDPEDFIERNRNRQIDAVNADDSWPVEAQVAAEECIKRVATLATGTIAQLRRSGG